ncbi:hypothetical protein RclHR1_09680005 [Rhizophagus clarus]|uniref:Nitrate/nitrite transporter n=1 Tax=Rhizophagus clarus TaxID=94130 RepID=A0A2Z6SF67_9GLOM|nr:hypothetical protein RclHR1_09680005 [Rhizophagus clarus]GES79740.1 NarK family nitrate/nitrite MFS transporter [Rhizophagus clarus]
MVKFFARPLPIDPVTQKADAINLLGFGRPHMRAFHLSWFSFLTAFTGWFSIAPLIPTIKEDLKLTTSQVNSSNLTSIASTFFFRALIGPLCDRFGPKRTMATLLTISAIPVGLSGLVKDATGFITLRFFIGIIGATFVPCQFWTTQMFSGSVVGCANALVGGWGNMGAGVTYVLMPLLFDAISKSGVSDHVAWRVAMVVPAGLCFIMGMTCLLFADDCPQGDWSKRKQQKTVEIHDANNEKNAEIHNANKANKNLKGDDNYSIASEEDQITHNPSRPTIGTFFKALKNPNVIILMFMYACSFGIELSVDNIIGLFFHDHFALSQTKAGLIGALFGLMNLFSRATGGFLSDFAYKKRGIKGRLIVHFILIFVNGIFLIVFRFSVNSLTSAIIILIIFSYFTQACCGSVFGIVPFVDPEIVGAISGLVGAGGNLGGLIFTGVFKIYGNNTPFAFMICGIVVMAVAFMTFLMRFK